VTQGELEADRAEVVANRETIAATVPADLLALYERQRDRYGVGASLLRGGVSSASGVALTGSDLAAVRAAAEDDVVLCPDSNAVLVRTYESGI
jgi:predicted  nucleic acid-binding Zn-ribbon protein